MAEFWNASTRLKERNGFALTSEETERNAQEIERSFVFLADNEAVYREWRRIVVQHRVSGVHNARLAAAKYVHGITHILTFNGSDYSRIGGLMASIRTRRPRNHEHRTGFDSVSFPFLPCAVLSTLVVPESIACADDRAAAFSGILHGQHPQSQYPRGL